MRRSTPLLSLAILAGALLGGLAGPTPALAAVALECRAVVTRPFDGQTAVPRSIEIEVFNGGGCGVVATFETAEGASVPFDVEGGEDETLRLVPRAKLPADTEFVVDLGNPAPPCGFDPGKVHFRTGGAPRLIGLSFATSGDKVVSATVELSEPVDQLTDFAPEAGHIVIGPKGGIDSLSTTDSVEDQRQRLVRSFRTKAGGLPSASQTWEVRIRRSLPFATGAQLAADMVFELVPAEQARVNWRAPDRPCTADERGGDGCSAAPGPVRGQAPWAWVLLACVFALVWLRAVPRRS